MRLNDAQTTVINGVEMYQLTFTDGQAWVTLEFSSRCSDATGVLSAIQDMLKRYEANK